METYAPIIATVVSGLVFAGLKWLGQHSTSKWHKWAIPVVTAALAVLRMGAQALGIELPEFSVEAAMATGSMLSIHQAAKGVAETRKAT